MMFGSPAKINLGLEIVGQRPDGFYEIRTLFQTIEFADTLEVDRGAGSGFHLEVQAGGMAVPEGEENLVHRAYEAFARATGQRPGLAVRLKKRIPPGSGLGGGSSNAAALLLHLRRRFGRPDLSTLVSLAAGLGSDVPFFLHGGTALGQGRGHRITPLDDAVKQLVLLVLPPIVISTGQVYARFTPLLTSESKRISIHRYLNGEGKVCLQRDIQRNDLESVVFRMYPLLGRLKALLYETGAGFASLSGSGSGLFGIYETEAAAVRAAGAFQALDCRTVQTRFLDRGACQAP